MPRSLQTDSPLAHAGLTLSPRRASWLADLARRTPTTSDGARKDGLDLDQPYQRGAVWTLAQQRLLIKSLLTGIPIPTVIVNDRYRAKYRDPLGRLDWRYAVIDGKQRTLALTDWFGGLLSVPASWFPADNVECTVPSADGNYVTFETLSDLGRRRCDTDFVVLVAEGRLSTLAAEAEVFALVNRAGTPMTEADLARAIEVAEH